MAVLAHPLEVECIYKVCTYTALYTYYSVCAIYQETVLQYNSNIKILFQHDSFKIRLEG